MTSGDDFGWLDDDAIVGYSMSFVDRVEPVDALERIGADVGSVPELSAAEADEFAPPSSNVPSRRGEDRLSAIPRVARCSCPAASAAAPPDTPP
ncbi:hypothetical protein GCM10025787_36150 [Saccharopolyspora rosea]